MKTQYNPVGVVKIIDVILKNKKSVSDPDPDFKNPDPEPSVFCFYIRYRVLYKYQKKLVPLLIFNL